MPTPLANLPLQLGALGVGELAALGAAACWVVTAMTFSAAGRRVGATVVNASRLVLALLVLLAIVRWRTGAWIPDLPARSLPVLVVSGLIGLALGDQLLFRALVLVGPRLATLVFTTLAPVVTALLAWPLLDEPLGPIRLGAMAVILTGLAIVVLERPARPADEAAPASTSARRLGLWLAGGGGVCQALGLLGSKLGMGRAAGSGLVAGWGAAAPVDAWVATLVRLAAATPAMLLVVALLAIRTRARTRRSTVAVPPDPLARRRARREAGGLILLGVVFGPVLGVASSMVAVGATEAGIAAVLMATTPLMVLPVVVVVDGERVSLRAVAGAMVAVAGVGLLSLD